MKKKVVFPLILLVVSFFIGGCASKKEVAYFQNIDSVNLANHTGLYDAKIMPKDLLTITVTTTDPEAARPFNLFTSLGTSGAMSSQMMDKSQMSYLVENDGYINFPVVGRLKVLGLTKSECENLIRSKIQPYMAAKENPVVIVRMSSYRVTVIGEVGGARVIPVSSEKMSIIEALASAGDMTIFGKRRNILLIREDAQGNKTAHRLDINDANILNSPYYYLQQNDIIYVEPNSVKVTNSVIGASTSLWLGISTSVLSMAAVIVSILKK